MYELTMSNGYFNQNSEETLVAFDVFYRKNREERMVIWHSFMASRAFAWLWGVTPAPGFSIFAGLEQTVEYIQNLHFAPDDVEYLRSRNLFTEDFLDYLLHFRFRGDMYAMPEGTIMSSYMSMTMERFLSSNCVFIFIPSVL